jgi:hypothetical protein
MTEESKMLYIIALSKRKKIHIGDAQALYDGVKAFEGMQLSGTIEGHEIKVGTCFGKIFQMNDPVNTSDFVHLALLGDFTEAERADVGHFISGIVVALPAEEYPFLAGDMVRYNGGRGELDLLLNYMKQTRH